ncbi:MAG: CDP-alcohol phosphatidyltransferase family protein [Alphaproteobacteria bacterium]|nr:CDP-alcohol phosphatidyltransferase family protein [Alphaproteobacteria bacterium]
MMILNTLQPYTCKIANYVYHHAQNFAKFIVKHNITANAITFCGLIFAVLGLNFLALEYYALAFLTLILNRICDILDGMCARLKKITPFGIFFDISADYTSFALYLWGFTLANPEHNAKAGIFMLVCLIISAVVLLSYALISKQDYKKLNQSSIKMCLWGNLQNFDTFIALVLMCLFNAYFMQIATFFGLLSLGKSLIIASKAYYALEINAES